MSGISTFGLSFGIAGLVMLALAGPMRPLVERWHTRRLHDRRLWGSDAWSDELRSLESYTPKHLALIFTGLGAACVTPAISELLPYIRTLVTGI